MRRSDPALRWAAYRWHLTILGAAGHVITVAMTVYQVGCGLVSNFGNFGPESGCGFRVNGAGNDHTGNRNDEHIDVKLILKAIGVVSHARDFTFDLLRRDAACCRHTHHPGRD
jgi:hypothetical protein